MNNAQILVEKIKQFIRKYYLNRLIRGLLVGAVLWMVFFLLLNAIEYFSWASSRVRFILFLFLILGSAYILIFYVIIPIINLVRYQKKMTLQEAAVIIGKFFPDIQDKLSNALQLNEQNLAEGNSLLEAAIDQHISKLSPFRFTDAVQLSENKRFLWYFVATFVVFALLVLFIPDFSVKPTQRIVKFDEEFERPLPFSVSFTEIGFNVLQGEDFQFGIKVEGTDIPEHFYVKSQFGTQIMQSVGEGVFVFTFRNVNVDIDFQILGNKYVSSVKHIKVHPKALLMSYEVEQVFPKYTKRKAETAEGKTHFIVPVGTKMNFRFYTRFTDEVALLKDSVNQTVNTKKADVWQYDLVVSDNSKLQLFTGNEWYKSGDAVSFVVEAVADAYPSIQVRQFSENMSKQYYFSGLISDDYGFSKLAFCYTISSSKHTKQISISLNYSLLQSSFFYSIDFDTLRGVAAGDEVDMYFEVWDNDGIKSPKSSKSENFVYRKPSLAELDSVVQSTENNLLDQMKGKSDEMMQLKEQIESMLRDLASKKELDWTYKEKLMDLLQQQKEMQDEWNKMQEQQKELSEFLNDNNLISEELLQKQEQINKLFEEVVPDEMKRLMAEIEKMGEDMPRDKMQKLVDEMKKDNKKLQQLLDRNLALLERWKLEKDLTAAIDKLDKLGEDLQNNDSVSAEQAKSEFNKLMDEMEKLSEENKESSNPLNFNLEENKKEEIENDLNEAETEENENQKSSQKKKSAGEKMQEMSAELMQQLQSSEDEQMGEDAYMVRVILENVVRASIRQEDLMNDIKSMKRDDPSFPEMLQRGSELVDNFVVIADSLREMAKRQPMIQNFVFDELQKIDFNLLSSLSALKNLHLSNCVNYQQYAFMSMNNLALMLSESLNQMNMSMGMGGGSSKQKGKQKSSEELSKQMQKLSEMQKQLGEKLKKMQQQKGNPGQQNMSSESEEFARMAAEQEMLREGLQQIIDAMKEGGQYGNDGLNKIKKDMEQLEEELVNKHINSRMIERNQNIIQRLLKAENAQLEREKEEKRKSNEFKGTIQKRKVDELKYEEMMRQQEDFLKYSPIEYKDYYKDRINNYYFNK